MLRATCPRMLTVGSRVPTHPQSRVHAASFARQARQLAMPVALCALAALPAACQRPPNRPDVDIQRALGTIDARRVEADVRTLVAFGTRSTLSDQGDTARGIGGARDWLFRQFNAIAAASGGKMTVSLQSYVQAPSDRIPGGVRITNVIALLKGDSEAPTDRICVVSGHYDSRCSDVLDAVHDAPGADDDGSGVATVLEAARVMAQLHVRAPVLFAAVAGEEQGLYGSSHMANEMKLRGWRVEGMLDNDIVGDTVGQNGVHDDHSVRLFSEGIPADAQPSQIRLIRTAGAENDSPARELARFIASTARQYVPGFHVTEVYRTDRYLRGGDHVPFLQHGWPAVRFTEPNEDFRHQHQDVRTRNGVQFGDLPEFEDFSYIGRVARVNTAALCALARAPASPDGAGILAQELSPDTVVVWNAVPGAAGYEIVWRPADAGDWRFSRYVKAVPGAADCSFLMKSVSKDNYLFGVRAVDREGHRSPVSFCWPKRERR